MTDQIVGLCFIVSLLTMLVTAVVTSFISGASWQDEAVAKGKAEYYTNEYDETSWRWK